MLLAHTSMESIPHVEAHEVAPSPRLPSGRLRSSPSKTGVNALSSATGYGEGRGEGAFAQAQTRGNAPSSRPSPRKRGEGEEAPHQIRFPLLHLALLSERS